MNMLIDKYFWLESLIPIFCLICFWLLSQRYLKNTNKRGYLFGFGFSVLGLFFIFCIWFFVIRFSSQIQCESAYGEMALDPKMCDNPGEGLLMFIQIPVLIFSWLVISVLSIYKLRPLRG